MRFYTANREAGTFIDEFDTYEEAKKAIEEYEAQDKTDGIYEADFYGEYPKVCVNLQTGVR